MVIVFDGSSVSCWKAKIKISFAKSAAILCAGLASFCTPLAAMSQELDLLDATEVTASAILKRAGVSRNHCISRVH